MMTLIDNAGFWTVVVLGMVLGGMIYNDPTLDFSTMLDTLASVR